MILKKKIKRGRKKKIIDEKDSIDEKCNLINSEIDDNEEDECYICYSYFKKNEKIITLKCNHKFHINCLKKSFEYICKIKYNNNLICSYCNQIHYKDEYNYRYNVSRIKRNIKLVLDKN